MHNMKLTVAYDGTDFRGWQIQPGQPTIQGLLTDVVRQLTQDSVTLQGAGRTDAGVHTWGQVVSFKTHSELARAEVRRRCNALLPPIDSCPGCGGGRARLPCTMGCPG